MTVYPGGPQDSIPYEITAPDGSRAVINDDTDPDYVGMGWWQGFDDSETREAIDPRTASDGAIQGLNFRGPRPLVLTVEVVAASTTDRNQKSQKLRRATNAYQDDGTIKFTPDGGLPSQVSFRKNTRLARNDERGWKYTYQVGLQCADPYIYSQTEHSSTSASAGGSSQTITNQGDGLAAPTFAITLASATDVTITNVTTGEQIVLNSVDPANIISFSMKFGSAGTGNSQFSLPKGVAVDSAGNIYVADTNNHKVKKFNSSGVYQSTIGNAAPGGYGGTTNNGDLREPTDVVIDSSDNIYVAHSGGPGPTGRVEKFNSAGVYQAKSTTGFVNKSGALAVDSANNIFAVDGKDYAKNSGTNAVRKFSSALGAQTATFGSTGTGSGQFSGIGGIDVDSSNQPWVVDIGGSRVQKFSNAATPVYVSQFDTSGVDGGTWGASPFGLAIDASNNIYVGDTASQAIAKFNSSGVYQTKFGTIGSGDGQFIVPLNLDITGSALYVADSWNKRIQKFSLASGAGVIEVINSVAAVTDSTGINLFTYVNVPFSSWWALVPGDNVVSVSGAGVSSWTATWRDAWG